MPVNLIAAPPEARQCGECAMCCYLPEIPVLEKKVGEWCVHCPSHHGCAAYDTRPEPCRDFNCQYITNTNLGAEWFPPTSHFMLSIQEGSPRAQVIVTVDPAHADAWRKEPYFGILQQWSAQHFVIICIGMRKILLFPDHEKDLGITGKGDNIEFIGIPLNDGGMRISGQLRKADGGIA